MKYFVKDSPISRMKFNAFLIKYKNEKRMIIVSSHDLLYVEKIATHIGVLHDKTLLYSGSIEMFKEMGSQSIDKELLKLISNTDPKEAQTHLEHLI